jgi:hypothetical protein
MSATEPSVNSEANRAQAPSAGGDSPAPNVGSEAGRRRELEAMRERSIERFALLQSELGGLFYEMAIRDHLQLDLLIERAAAMQRVEDELRRIDRELVQS